MRIDQALRAFDNKAYHFLGGDGTWQSPKDRQQIMLEGTGILAESFPKAAIAALAAVGGVGATAFPSLMPIGLRKDDIVTGAIAHIGTVGASVTVCKLGLFSKTGTFLKATADVKASLAANTPLQQPFAGGAYTVPADDTYYVAFFSLQNAGTAPTIARAASQTNLGTALAGGVSNPASSNAAISDLAADVTIGSFNGAFWLAVYGTPA